MRLCPGIGQDPGEIRVRRCKTLRECAIFGCSQGNEGSDLPQESCIASTKNISSKFLFSDWLVKLRIAVPPLQRMD